MDSLGVGRRSLSVFVPHDIAMTFVHVAENAIHGRARLFLVEDVRASLALGLARKARSLIDLVFEVVDECKQVTRGVIRSVPLFIKDSFKAMNDGREFLRSLRRRVARGLISGTVERNSREAAMAVFLPGVIEAEKSE